MTPSGRSRGRFPFVRVVGVQFASMIEKGVLIARAVYA